MNFLLNSHAFLLETASPVLDWLLKRRLRQGKEDGARIKERTGQPGIQRPDGPLIWIHGASVGEAQSTLIVIDHLKQFFPHVTILLTTGTVSSARYLEQRLPEGVVHQYYPLDRPVWVESFLFHWKPDFVLWMESELWPVMLQSLQRRKIPVVLMNARMSPRSFKRWQYFPRTARLLLQTFTAILTQTKDDAAAYKKLGARQVKVTGNLKYAATPLSVNDQDLSDMIVATKDRPLWVYASTHKGEEELACRVHRALLNKHPYLLTMIVPRHPERRDDIMNACQNSGLKIQFRSEHKILPAPNTDIYIADTLGELGLFYRIAPIACIGRSFSDDGGGGHNPIEAAQLGCAVLHGPHVQNLKAIYRHMDKVGAAKLVADEKALTDTLSDLLTNQETLSSLSNTGLRFVQRQAFILETILQEILPLATDALQTRKVQP